MTPSPDDLATTTDPADDFKPFPVDVLPDPLCGFVAAAATAIGCDPSYLALPLLVALAAAIGNTRRLLVKRGWLVPPVLWAALVGESGTAKSVALRLALKPFQARQRRAMAEHATAMTQYAAELAEWEEVTKHRKRSNRLGELPLSDDNVQPADKPTAPSLARNIVSDTTVEALAPLLLVNPRGVLLARDELAGWIGSFDRYSKGKGGDSASWLSTYNAESICIDRKTGIPPTIYVPSAAVCVVGGIQPGILHRALGEEHRESGLAARLLLAYPPRKAKRWTDAEIDPAAEAELAGIVDRLYSLTGGSDDNGDSTPVVIGMARDAHRLWRDFYDFHNVEQAKLEGDMAAAWSKLEETPARLALVIHYVRWAASGGTLRDTVDADTMTRAIRLAAWFKGEATRVYRLLGDTDANRDVRRLVAFIKVKGGRVTSHAVQAGCRWLRDPGMADDALQQLAKGGMGAWESVPPGKTGGRPSQVFVLQTPKPAIPVSETPRNPPKIEVSLTLDTLDTVKTRDDVTSSADVDPASEWGAV